MSTNSPFPDDSMSGQTPRQRYRAIMARRQMKVFGITIAATAVALVFALLGLTGIIPTPFGEEFSRSVSYAETGDTPCPTEDARAQGPDGVNLQVLNSSSISGLAGSVAEALVSVGYAEPLVDNGAPFRGNVQIEAGPDDIDQAYSLARFFSGTIRIRLADNMPKGTITILLGQGFDSDHIPTAETAAAVMASDDRLQPLPNCLPVNPDRSARDQDQSGQQSGVQSGEAPAEESAEAPTE